MEQNGSSALQALWGHLAKPRPPWTRQPSAVSRVGRCGACCVGAGKGLTRPGATGRDPALGG